MSSKQNYQRTVDELRKAASMQWPADIAQKESDASVIPKLLETQDNFISILSVPVSDVDGLFQIMEMTELPGNLLLKHLVVLADFGGEQLQRVNSDFDAFFPKEDGKRVMRYRRGSSLQSYTFQELPVSGRLTNARLHISGTKLLKKQPFDALSKDVAMLLMFGSAVESEDVARKLASCEIGDYLGKSGELARFVKQRYIWVSRVTAGARSNTMGQLAQAHVKEYLEANIGVPGLSVASNGTLPGVYEREESKPSRFDVVVDDGTKFVGIEVCFQVTTNSVIERKAGQASGRFDQINDAGYRVAYVLDGAGNMTARESAVRDICNHSHCTVAFTPTELDVLCEFLRDYFQSP